MTQAIPQTCSASASATSSNWPARAARISLLLALAALAGARTARAGESPSPPADSCRAGSVFLTADEALALAFPTCELARATVYLTEKQLERAGALAGERIEAAITRPWTATRHGKLVGTAYLDTHRVRTLSETILVVVDPRGRVSRIELLSFAEPEEYIPRGNWYGQFVGKELDLELRLKGSIRPVTGASLTAVATTNAVRRVLALHRTLSESSAKSAHDGSGKP